MPRMLNQAAALASAIATIIGILLTTSVAAAPSKPSVADQIRHPQGQRMAGGNCTTTCRWIGN
jgi:hypothetical protein